MSQKCTQCGESADPDARFCEVCGAKLTSAPSGSAAEREPNGSPDDPAVQPPLPLEEDFRSVPPLTQGEGRGEGIPVAADPLPNLPPVREGTYGASSAVRPAGLLPTTAKELYDPELSAALGQAQAESNILVEAETNRPYLQKQASLLRFRVTNMTGAPERPCDVTIRMRLHGQDPERRRQLVEQEAEEMEQTCHLDRRGDPHLFSLAFWPLEAGEVAVDQLRVTVAWPDGSAEALELELPDKSLSVSITDPALPKDKDNVVISGGIHIDFGELKEMYGADVKDILTINAQREAAAGEPGIEWKPIRLRERKPSPPPPLQITQPGDVALELVRIRAGEFIMGSPEGQGRDDEGPARRVRITRDFCLGKFPVTQEQYQSLMGQNPSKFPTSPQHPVDNVSWKDAQEFCRRLHAYLGKTPDAISDSRLKIDAVRLPTEAEWEYACRAGSETRFSFGDDRKKLTDYGWCLKNSEKNTHAVGELQPNAWGLHEMYGNVWEWCQDVFAPGYASSPQNDPQGPPDGERHVLRGGSWSCSAKDCRSARRHSAGQEERTANYGFRIVVYGNVS